MALLDLRGSTVCVVEIFVLGVSTNYIVDYGDDCHLAE